MSLKIQTNAEAMALWLERSVKALGNHSDRLNAINIFPVADGDTGSNLYLTARTAQDAVSRWETKDVGELLTTASRAAMESARGNSGTLLAVFLAGFAEPLMGHERLGAAVLAQALERAKVRAWSALSEPVSGTMLSVFAAAAEAAARIARNPGSDISSKAALIEMLEAVRIASRAAVVSTEELLDPLAKANVVDAGAVGMLILIDELHAVVTGTVVDSEQYSGLHGYDIQDPHIHATASPVEGFEVMCTINLDPLGAATLRGELDAVGDSVILSPVNPTDSGYRWRIHVHAPRAESALEVIRKHGSPVNVSITDLCSHDG